MNTPVRRVALAVMGMFALLLANVTYIQLFQGDDLREHPRNLRRLEAEYGRERGQIIAGGVPLAGVVDTGGRLRYQRTYAEGPVFAPVTGYYSLNHGMGGMEAAMNSVLNGTDSRLFVRRISDMLTGREPAGGSVALTIRPDMQRLAYELLTSNGYTGSVVALRPDTGEILTMASAPSYDPNVLASQDGSAEAEAWAQLHGEGSGRPMLNRSISEVYPPGSTFKLVMAAAALESGDYTPESQLTAAPELELVNGGTIPNYADSNCGSGDTTSLHMALARSCNTAFAQLAAQLGEEQVREMAENMGMETQDLTIPLPVATSTMGPIPDTSSLQQSAIGQRDVRITPLQDAMFTAAIANEGVRMRPQLVRNILAPDLSELDSFSPEEAERAMPSGVADQVREMMIDSEEHTGGSGQLSDVTVASKTGTAQHGDDDTPPHSWYTAFAPADDPQVAVAVLVEGIQGQVPMSATGGQIAAPIGRAVIEAALQGAG